MLDLEVILTAQSVTDQQVEGRTVVVIDVLRATSSMLTAFSNQARAIVPVSSLEEAVQWQQKLGTEPCVLCGEKDGLKIPGYDVGNSPQEFTMEAVGGKIIIMNTTNGTKAITNARRAGTILIGSFLNAQSVVDELIKKAEDITIVCSGWKERLSLEDMLCAGLIIDRLVRLKQCTLNNDYAKITHATYKSYQGDILAAVTESSHALRLKAIAPAKDFEYCSQIDVISITPYVKNEMIMV